MPASPTVASWELGIRLRERRELNGHTATWAAKKTRCTQGYLSEVERGKTKIAKDLLVKLIAAYEFDEAEAEELLSLRDVGSGRAWWNAYTGIFGDGILRFFGYEHGAESIRTYDGGLVPGLLQSEDYIRATIRGAGPNIRLAELDRRTEARLLRQKRLADDEPLDLTAVINEAVLRQHVGGRQVMIGQLHHLVSMCERHKNIDVRVVPFTADCYHALGGSSFHIAGFTSPRLPTLVWQETVTSTELIDHAMKVREYSVAYTQAMDAALSQVESLDLIGKIAKEFT